MELKTIERVAFFYNEGAKGEDFIQNNKFRCLSLLFLSSEFAALDSTAKEIGLGENIAVKLNRRKRNAKTQYHARQLQQLKSLCISHKI